jgi:cell filamentation protein
MNKNTIRIYKDFDVRVTWDEEKSKWYFSVVDIISIFNNQTDYVKASNYWHWLKKKFIKDNNEFVSETHRLKLMAKDSKKYLSDTIDAKGIISLAKNYPSNKPLQFLEWFLYSDNTIDGQSKKKAYTLWESNLIDTLEIGTTKSLQKIHSYIFGGLYDFAGKVRTASISKDGFKFSSVQSLDSILKSIDLMQQSTFDEIVDKYVMMNIAHPFLDGNGRSMRIWLDLILKHSIKKCIDWSIISKNDYLIAMKNSIIDSTQIRSLLGRAFSDKIEDKEVFMKGIDYSYYYEEIEED